MKDTGMEYAVKIMEKRFIKKEKKVKFVMMERKVFSKVSHDRIVKLYFTFQVWSVHLNRKESTSFFV